MSMKLQPGKVFFVDPNEGMTFIGEATELDLYQDLNGLGSEEVPTVMRTTGVLTCAVKTTKGQFQTMYDVFLCLLPTILQSCPNKRVAHLARYGKKAKTRNKNRHRAIRILEKEVTP